MRFDELGLCAELLRAIAEEGYTDPTPVQSQGIPPVLRGQDIMAGAQTGTGKTAAFALPILEKLKQHANASVSPARHPVRALIITPTRELAAQVFESIRTYGKYISLRSACVFGGVNIDPQIAELRAGVEILVATPGRLLDHVHQRTVNLGQVEILVLDEADRMLDMGFMPDIKRILALLPAKRQSLMFSATFPEDIKRLAAQMLKDPVRIQVAPSNAVTDLVTHSAFKVDVRHKRDFLEHLIRDRDMRQVLVFTRTKISATRLARELLRDGYPCAALHSDRTQQERMRALADFKDGKLQLLVATDIAARGLDIEQLPHVINYELPHNPEDYIHRIGRTGRAGQPGEAISLVAPDEEENLASIERLLKTRITISVAPDAGRSGRRGTNDRESERPVRRPAPVRESGHSERRPPRERQVEHAVPAAPDAEYVTPPSREPDRRPDERPAALVNRPGAAAGGPTHKPKREIPALFLPPVVEKQGN
jgi:ATP-dependent RNA helicase RhlE